MKLFTTINSECAGRVAQIGAGDRGFGRIWTHTVFVIEPASADNGAVLLWNSDFRGADAGAFAREGKADRLSDSAGAARHDRDLIT